MDVPGFQRLFYKKRERVDASLRNEAYMVTVTDGSQYFTHTLVFVAMVNKLLNDISVYEQSHTPYFSVRCSSISCSEVLPVLRTMLEMLSRASNGSEVSPVVSSFRKVALLRLGETVTFFCAVLGRLDELTLSTPCSDFTMRRILGR